MAPEQWEDLSEEDPEAAAHAARLHAELDALAAARQAWEPPVEEDATLLRAVLKELARRGAWKPGVLGP